MITRYTAADINDEDLDRLYAHIETVTALLTRIDTLHHPCAGPAGFVCSIMHRPKGPHCNECSQAWPCNTRTVLTQEIP